MKISTKYDWVALRFLMGLSVKQLSKEIGMGHDQVEALESGKAEMLKRHCLAIRTLVEEHPNVEWIRANYISLNTEAYYRFLLQQTPSGDLLPRTRKFKCKCGSEYLRYDWSQSGSDQVLFGTCLKCGNREKVQSIATIREQVWKAWPQAGIFNEHLYDMDLWSKGGFKTNGDG
ncbi:hypothetical protein [Vibrio barjaei]|uniref:hypothetical protein n=1 Tax=Vibrio barjaei TaxID=1676683 RepID=UPI0022843BB2|nr:hypothetical protein [Vibrio barjaei]MCY9873017.1 hypothetical protein [Vibrio barjaei]